MVKIMRYTVSLTAAGILSLGLITGLTAQLFHSDELSLSGQTAQAEMPQMAFEAHSHSHDHLDLNRSDYRSPGKPGADVTLISPQIRALPLGVASELQLEMTSHLPKGTLRVSLELSDGLTLTSGEREWQFDVEGAESVTLPIGVQADIDGQHYIHLFIEHQSENGVSSARALATEIRVGGGILHNMQAKSFR